MATFAIVRANGKVDKVTDGASVADVSDRYGAPGNGSIEPWDEGKHGDKLAHTFQSPAEQLAAWEKVAKAEGQFGKVAKADTADTADTKADSKGDK